MFFGFIGGTMIDVNEFSDEELEAHLHELLEKIASIKYQIDTAKSKCAETGDYSDNDWFNRAKYALRMNGREQQIVQAELAKRRKAKRRQYNNTVERNFMEVAKRRLDPDLFKEFVSEAEDCAQI